MAKIMGGFQNYAHERSLSLLTELAGRRMEPLHIYEPLPWIKEFHSSKCPERLVLGANRSGKSLATFLEVARAVTNTDPYGKYPKTGKAYIVGYDGRHIGETFYPKFFKEGGFSQFRLIRDLMTDQWRAWRPWEESDWERRAQTRPHPPLISPRFVAELSYEKKRENIVSYVILTTGWEMRFFSSKAIPTKGSDVDLCLFDEEVMLQDWYAEVSARLFDRKGKFIWSVAPQEGGMVMVELFERAQREEELPPEERTTECYRVKLDQNTYFTAEERSILRKKFTSEHDIQARIEGEIVYYGGLVYPEFKEEEHVIDWFGIPRDWTRYVAIDPGRQIGASLFLAVPPPKLDDRHPLAKYAGDFVYLYDEIYIARCNAELWGQAMADKCAAFPMEAFIIDWQEGRKGETGSGRQIAELYSNALRKRKLQCRRSAYNFTQADASRKAGVEELRTWLLHRDQAGPKLRILRGKCQNFIDEMKRFSHVREKTAQGWIISDRVQERGRVHLVSSARYLAMERPMYVAEEKTSSVEGILDFLKQMRDKEAKRKGLIGASLECGPDRKYY